MKSNHTSKKSPLPQLNLLSTAPFNTFDDGIESIVNTLQRKKNIVVLVGAGISVSCGIPDFRSEKTGIYHTMDANELGLSTPEELFHMECFQDDPRPFYKFATKMLYPIKPIEPSPSHRFLSILEKKKILLRVYTQNIDGLEEKAGVSSKKIVYAHGTLNTSTCLTCSAKASADELREEILKGHVPYCKRVLNSNKKRKRKRKDGSLSSDDIVETPLLQPPKSLRRRRSTSSESGTPNNNDYQTNSNNTTQPPRTCNGVMKPNITFFGEPLVDRVRKCLESDRKKADAVIVIGTSLSVAPMSKIIEYLSPSIPRILINQKMVVPKHGVYGEDGGRKVSTTTANSVDDESSDEENKDHRSGYIFDSCLLGNCDSVTNSLMDVMNNNTSKPSSSSSSPLPSSSSSPSSITTKLKKKKLKKNNQNNELEQPKEEETSKNNEYEILNNIPELKAQVTERMLYKHPYHRIILFPGAKLGHENKIDDTNELENSKEKKNEKEDDNDDTIRTTTAPSEEIVYKEVVHCDGCHNVIMEDSVVMKCTECFDYDLCMECYRSTKVTKEHFSGLHHFVVERL